MKLIWLVNQVLESEKKIWVEVNEMRWERKICMGDNKVDKILLVKHSPIQKKKKISRSIQQNQQPDRTF